MINMKGTLEGVRILDLTRVLAGPFSGMLFADMGAEVIKIEMPGKGDDSRSFGPFQNGESAYFMNLNRNKKGITLNLKSPKGIEVFKKLVKEADIVLENYRPGVMEKLGIGYETLKEINPKIVYGCVSGFGHYGPYSNRAGYDIIGQAMGGLMSTTGWPGGEPTRSGTAIADVLAGLFMSVGVASAYANAIKTGLGQKVDVALVDSVVAGLEIINQIYLVEGVVPQRNGNRYESVYPYDSFKVSDGSIVIGAGNDKLFAKLCELMNKEELLEDERYLTNPLRIKNHAPLKAEIEAWTINYSIDELVELILSVGVPAAPINTIDRVVKDPHIAEAREMFVDLDHPKAGKLKITGNPIKFSENKYDKPVPSPSLGQHNLDVLTSLLGYSKEEAEAMIENGVL